MDRKNKIKLIVKIVGIGISTTFVRLIMQLFMPEGTQDVLQPSIFVKNGTLPIMFLLYGIIAYTSLAAVFLLFYHNISGSGITRGLKYGILLSILWSVYLLEPLPHVNRIIDKISYSLVDSLALIFMGLALGVLVCEKIQDKKELKSVNKKMVLSICICFIVGRMIQYNCLHIYSSYSEKTVETIMWVVITGLVIGISLAILNKYHNKFLICLLFSINMIFFNFFMPLVFDADIPDLIIRTLIDILFVTLGILLLKIIEKRPSPNSVGL